MHDLYVPYNVIYGKNAYYFSWKCIHRAVYTETKLFKMNKSSGICKLCMSDRETICHLIYECSKVNDVWKKIEELIINVTKTEVELIKRNILFNFKDETPLDIFCNFIILNTKYCIWKNRNNVKFDDRQCVSISDIVKQSIKTSHNLLSVILKSNCNITAKLKSFLNVFNEMYCL